MNRRMRRKSLPKKLLLLNCTIALSGGLIFRNLISRINIEFRGEIMRFVSFFTSFGAAIGPIVSDIVWDSFGAKAQFIISIFVELSLI